MIRPGLQCCFVYLSYSGIQIRPMIPPTFENRVFSGARQRIYLSATLGGAGELERAFGRPEIGRMPLPTKTPPRSGRRLFVFPGLAQGDDPEILTKAIVHLTDKALVLSQDSIENAEQAAQNLASDDVPVLGKSAVENGLTTFARAAVGVLGLANRYDGIDLPGSACRIVVLDGSPDAASLQEKFLSERAQASAALAERLRTRIVQGAGRCTRGPSDYAVVVVRGSDITKYFSQPQNRKALEPELQAEVEFGWNNSRGQACSEILDNVQTFLEHDVAWRDGGEPLIIELRDDAVRTEPPGAAVLGESSKFEVEAWRLAFSADWVAASQKLEQAATLVGQGGEAIRGYRALLLYTAGVWLHLGAEGEGHRGHARQLVRNAAKATRGTWIKEMQELPGADEAPLSGADSVATNALVARLMGQLKPAKIRAELAQMREALGQEDSGPYEAALSTLGKYLGAAAAKPAGKARCDSAWRWDMALWVAIEAKSEEHADGLLPSKDIRQANTQLDQMVLDDGIDHAPAGSGTILISDRLTVDPQHAGTANPNVYLASTEVITQIASDVEVVWSNLLAATAKQQSVQGLRRHVQEILTENGCLPTQVIDRLMQDRIRPGE